MDVFDIKNCVRKGDVVYFWDTHTKTVVKCEMSAVKVEDVPEDAIKALLHAANIRSGNGQ